MTLPSVKRLPYLRQNLVQRRKSEISAGFNLRSENKEGLNIFKNPLMCPKYIGHCIISSLHDKL